MSDTLLPGEMRRHILVLAINRTGAAIKAELEASNAADVLTDLVGANVINSKQIEIFALCDIEELGLSGFLETGHGIEPAALAPHKARLDALEGYVALVLPGAFGKPDVTLPASPDVTPIADLPMPGTDWAATKPVTSASAHGTVTPARKVPSDAAMSGRIAMIALLVIFLLTGLIVWIAG